MEILIGKQTPKITQHRHDTLSVFGVGADLRDTEWRGVIRQLLAQGLLAVEGDHGTLALTPASDEVLYRGRQVMLRREPERAVKVARSRATASPAVDLAPDAVPLFEQLRAWRAATAKEQGVPAYVIFHDATLRQIAARKPATLAELGTIGGVGETKLARYGQPILDVLAG